LDVITPIADECRERTAGDVGVADADATLSGECSWTTSAAQAGTIQPLAVPWCAPLFAKRRP